MVDWGQDSFLYWARQLRVLSDNGFANMPQISKPVVEVVVAQMLHMALHDSSSKRKEPILIAINSQGTQNGRGEAIASDVEPFAILDVMMAINLQTEVCLVFQPLLHHCLDYGPRAI